MKHLLTLLLLLSAKVLFGQFDVIIDPIETETIQPSSYELATGNWTPIFHQTYVNRGTITVQADRHVDIFIHDTAGKYSNKYLNNSAVIGKSFTGEPLTDGHGHSTHVAGCIAAYSKDFPLGVAGMISKYIKVHPFKCLTNSGGGQFTWITESFITAYKEGLGLQKKGHFVIHNLSLGGGSFYQPLEDAIQKARDAGQLVFIASGNTGAFPVQYPGRAKGANAVAAIDQQGNRATFSSWGNEIYMSAGGVSVLSTMPNDQLAKLSGTSMATPTLAGLAAIVACTDPKATANQIENFLVHYATEIDPQGWDNKTGYGTPKWGKYIGHSAENEPNVPLKDPVDDPDEPIEEEPTREKRDLTFYLPTYKTIWKTASGPTFKELNIDFKVTINSKYYDETAYDKLKEEFDWFFCVDGSCGRGFVLKEEHGFKDAIYYSGLFAEMLINRRDSDLGIKIELINGTDNEGRTAEHKRQALERLSGKVKMFGVNKPMTLTYSDN